MSELAGQVGELNFTVTVTRKETGKVEEYHMSSNITAEQAQALGIETKQEHDDDKRSDPLGRE